jgi:FkbM family methyltransferase
MSDSPSSVAATPRRLTTVGRALSTLSRHAWFIEDEVGALAHWVKPGDVCIDIGAEYGLYSVAMAARVGPTGRVHSIEPQADDGRMLDLAVRMSGADAIVTTHRLAMAEVEGEDQPSVPWRRGLPVHGRAYLARDAEGPGPNVEFATSRLVSVQVTTLDAFCRAQGLEAVHVVKADVEGAELKVLRGGLETLRRHRPAIQLEIKTPHLAKYGASADEVVAFLRELGYGMRCRVEDAWQPVECVTAERRNYLYLPSLAAMKRGSLLA